ncbi:D-arabinono-1,4-lactone oxidase [Micromonospora sagamiensis]|uniref:Xylitol oxidase n=1 Tax=Micromonospora sagamiensis TaxID=47875 RepID=A0A562WC75_9ACTN|nr:D-arabinono-1,4-lactone oxidase [Micromonospora sagamiensis]TWJ27873.1 xylitol oxidase [Micromonospora sagamiensis]BCL13238.1 putative xylitol oxidase [Micromonospora sagamiensis]
MAADGRGTPDTGVPPRNWAGNVTWSAARRHRPTSVDELRDLVAASRRVRAVGSRHSFNRLADTSGDLVAVDGLPPTVEVDPAAGTATVAAGLRYGEVATRLHEQGYACANLASLPHISVAGAVATATHGSGVRNGNLATSVVAVELVTADGDLVRVDSSDGRFAALVVGLGAFGVVTRLTLALVPAFEMRQYVHLDLPREAMDEAFASAYSVSLFTSWRGPGFDQVWRKQLVDQEPPPARWLGATAADTPRHPVPGMSADPCTVQLGVPGPWYERLPHFRPGFTPSSGAELQSEYHVPRAAAVEALAALDGVRDRIASVLQICELRTVAADRLWLSPQYDRDTCSIHFTWIADAGAVAPVVAAVEERLATFAPRPHWGKVFGLTPTAVAAAYPRFADAVAATVAADPTGKFRNDLLERYLPR